MINQSSGKGQRQLRAALYTRVSSQEQAVHGISLAEQKERLELWCRVQGWQVVNLYSDEGVSGGTDDRPQLQLLMYAAKQGEFDILLVSKLDRFFRNVRLMLNYLKELDELGVRFISTSEGLDSSTPSGKFSIQILGVIAEWERERISERVKDARNHLAGQGRWSSGRTLFGTRFNKDKKEIEIYEPEASVVRFIFNRYTANESMGIIRLAEILNKEGRLTPRMGRRQHSIWTQSAVRHILTHPAYKGGPNDAWQFKCPAIVDTSLWGAAQKRLTTNRHFKPGENRSIFQGLIKCGLCGHILRIGYDHSTVRKYECPGRLKRLHLDGTMRCSLPRFNAAQLEKHITIEIHNIFSDKDVLKKHLTLTLNELQEEREELERKLSPLRAEISRVQGDMSRIDAMLEVRRISPEDYKTRITSLQAKLRSFKKQTNEADPMLLQEIDRNDKLLMFYYGEH